MRETGWCKSSGKAWGRLRARPTSMIIRKFIPQFSSRLGISKQRTVPLSTDCRVKDEHKRALVNTLNSSIKVQVKVTCIEDEKSFGKKTALLHVLTSNGIVRTLTVQQLGSLSDFIVRDFEFKLNW